MKRTVEYKVNRDLAEYTSGQHRLPGTHSSCRDAKAGARANVQYNGQHVRITSLSQQQLQPRRMKADEQGYPTPDQIHLLPTNCKMIQLVKAILNH